MRALTLLALCLLARAGGTQDCNRNGSPDADDVAGGASKDCNSNGFPDECDVLAVSFGFAPHGFAEVGAPAGVASADLNRDGWPDVAVALTGSMEVAVLLGEDGAFPVTSYFPLSLPPLSIRLADLDADGHADAAAATADGVAILWNDGTGKLAGETALLVGQGTPSLHVADLDRDGDPDLLTLNRDPAGSPSNISVLSNEGGRRFAAPRHYSAGEGSLALALADLDGDGDPDAAVVGTGPLIRILENDGGGRFPQGTTRPLLFSPTDVTAGKFDRDGNVDLCLSRVGMGRVVVVLNLGDGTFAELAPVEAGTNFTASASLVTADLDGDGSLDVAFPGALTVLLNDGAGLLEPRRIANLFGTSGVAADLDRDGDMDLVTAENSGVGFQLNEPVALSADCNQNSVPDECEIDCNLNEVPDECDLASGTYGDCNGNAIPDVCEPDCDRNDVADDCDLAAGSLRDCNGNRVPDSCELPIADCNGNGVPDDCDVGSGTSADCNANGVPDDCDVASIHGFRGMARVPLASYREDFTLADIDGDGLVDLLAWDWDTVLLFRDPGHRGFASGTILASGASAVAVADIDGDGDLDICMAKQGRYIRGSRGDIALLLQRRDGGFDGRTVFTLPFPVQSLVAADADADGVLDICISGDKSVLVLRGLGGGALDEPFVVFGRAGALTPADLDRDGDADLLSLESSGKARVLINDGKGLFTERGGLEAGARGLIADDLDGDGDLDIATGRGHLYANDGTAGFTEAQRLGNPRNYPEGGRSVASGDVDGDGDHDLLLLDEETVWTLRNDGGVSFLGLNKVNLPTRPLVLASRDLDGDGLADLVGRGGELWILLSLGGPEAYGRSVIFYEDRRPSPAIVSDDLDGDGDRDLVVAKGGGLVAIHQNRGDGLFDTDPPLEVGGNPADLEAADYDGDGDLDVALGGSSPPRVLLLWNDRSSTLRPGEPLNVGGEVSSMASADLDGDGDLDLAVVTRNRDQVSLFLHDRDERFVAADPVALEGRHVFVTALDADGDGDVDLAVGRQFTTQWDPGFSFLLNDGRSRFDPEGTVRLHNGPVAARAGDFDGDGRTDLAVSLDKHGRCEFAGCGSDGTILLFLREADGRFRERAVVAAEYVSESFEVADLDLDGDLDLALPHSFLLSYDTLEMGAGVEVLLNDGGGSFTNGSRAPAGTETSAVAVSDLDGDGLPDLAAVSPQSLSITYSRLAGPSLDQDLDGVPDECASTRFRRGDADADGTIGLTDAVALLEHLFRGGAAPACAKAADANDDGQVNITDPVSLLEHLFRGGPAPPAPHASCGLDPTPDTLPCEAHSPCA